jgi:multiple RNA-binding domain-containing protein 1
VKSCRIPRKFDGQHRGFAFLDFLTHEEAKNALESLAHTHIYGRHLVIEWADEESDTMTGAALDALRAKTHAEFYSGMCLMWIALSVFVAL